MEKKAEEEKQELSSQRRELFQARKSKKQELRNLERKMENAVLVSLRFSIVLNSMAYVWYETRELWETRNSPEIT